MPYSTDAEIRALTRRFMDRTLPKTEWSHAAHFAVALCLLKDRGAATYAELPSLIRAYNEATRVENTDHDGYHETITVASLKAVDAWLAHTPRDRSLDLILADLLASPLGRSDWLLKHWSKDRLFSVAARRNWLEPDLEPLVFDHLSATKP